MFIGHQQFFWFKCLQTGTIVVLFIDFLWCWTPAGHACDGSHTQNEQWHWIQCSECTVFGILQLAPTRRWNIIAGTLSRFWKTQEIDDRAIIVSPLKWGDWTLCHDVPVHCTVDWHFPAVSGRAHALTLHAAFSCGLHTLYRSLAFYFLFIWPWTGSRHDFALILFCWLYCMLYYILCHHPCFSCTITSSSRVGYSNLSWSLLFPFSFYTKISFLFLRLAVRGQHFWPGRI